MTQDAAESNDMQTETNISQLWIAEDDFTRRLTFHRTSSTVISVSIYDTSSSPSDPDFGNAIDMAYDDWKLSGGI